MADELQYYGDPAIDSGLTVTARVYNDAGTQVGTDVTCTEVGSLAIYQGDMPTAAAGTYVVRFSDSDSNLLGHGMIEWDGSAEVTQQTLNAVLATKASQASVDTVDGIVDAILVDTNELQSNQGDWATATGFATPANVTSAQNAIQTDIGNLNNFDPASEQVTVSTNNDKSGYSISGTKNTLDDLNDISTAGVKAQADQALTDYGVDTLTNVKPSVSV